VKWINKDSVLLVIAEGVKESEANHYQLFSANTICEIVLNKKLAIQKEFVETGKKKPRFNLVATVPNGSIFKVVRYGTSKIYSVNLNLKSC